LSNSKEDDLICLTGSLYTVGEAKRYFNSTGRINPTPTKSEKM